jgi:hypothetical protein
LSSLVEVAVELVSLELLEVVVQVDIGQALLGKIQVAVFLLKLHLN